MFDFQSLKNTRRQIKSNRIFFHQTKSANRQRDNFLYALHSNFQSALQIKIIVFQKVIIFSPKHLNDLIG